MAAIICLVAMAAVCLHFAGAERRNIRRLQELEHRLNQAVALLEQVIQLLE